MESLGDPNLSINNPVWLNKKQIAEFSVCIYYTSMHRSYLEKRFNFLNLLSIMKG